MFSVVSMEPQAQVTEQRSLMLISESIPLKEQQVELRRQVQFPCCYQDISTCNCSVTVQLGFSTIV